MLFLTIKEGKSGTVKKHFTPTRMTIVQKPTVACVFKATEKLEVSHIDSGNVK